MMKTKVECHSGIEYAQTPCAWMWDGRRSKVEKVITETRSPSEKRFFVQSTDGQSFTLVYRCVQDEWFAQPMEQEGIQRV